MNYYLTGSDRIERGQAIPARDLAYVEGQLARLPRPVRLADLRRQLAITKIGLDVAEGDRLRRQRRALEARRS